MGPFERFVSPLPDLLDQRHFLSPRPKFSCARSRWCSRQMGEIFPPRVGQNHLKGHSLTGCRTLTSSDTHHCLVMHTVASELRRSCPNLLSKSVVQTRCPNPVRVARVNLRMTQRRPYLRLMMSIVPGRTEDASRPPKRSFVGTTFDRWPRREFCADHSGIATVETNAPSTRCRELEPTTVTYFPGIPRLFHRARLIRNSQPLSSLPTQKASSCPPIPPPSEATQEAAKAAGRSQRSNGLTPSQLRNRSQNQLLRLVPIPLVLKEVLLVPGMQHGLEESSRMLPRPWPRFQEAPVRRQHSAAHDAELAA